MSRPRLLDLFCKAGGCAVGYARAGFEVVGVDIEPQKNYPFKFIQADAIDKLRDVLAFGSGLFDAIHASPPCQAHSKTKSRWKREHPNLIPAVRALLVQIGLPWVIENVEGAPLDGTVLCGSMFGLEVRRHRIFEASFKFDAPYACDHDSQRGRVVGVYGHSGAGSDRGRPRANGQTNGVADWKRAMGIDWMTGAELAQAIPPAYCEWVGGRLMENILAKSG